MNYVHGKWPTTEADKGPEFILDDFEFRRFKLLMWNRMFTEFMIKVEGCGNRNLSHYLQRLNKLKCCSSIDIYFNKHRKPSFDI